MTNLLVVDGLLGPLYLTGGLAGRTPETLQDAADGTLLKVIIANMEKTSVGYTLIDYLYIEPGYADYTPLDERLK
jgi:hypothetical protein